MFNQNDPRFNEIDPMKIKIIMEIKKKSKNKSLEEMLPQIMQINQELNKRNMNFTNKETELLLEMMEEDMDPVQKQRFQFIKSMMF